VDCCRRKQNSCGNDVASKSLVVGMVTNETVQLWEYRQRQNSLRNVDRGDSAAMGLRTGTVVLWEC
jgi:hypothetical protein